MMHCRVTQTNFLFLWQLVFQNHSKVTLMAEDILSGKARFFLRLVHLEIMEYVPIWLVSKTQKKKR